MGRIEMRFLSTVPWCLLQLSNHSPLIKHIMFYYLRHLLCWIRHRENQHTILKHRPLVSPPARLQPVMADAFVITGSRPPSASGRVRPLSGRSNNSGYRKVSASSNVDETLFGSHNYKTHNPESSFKYPWVTTSKDDKKKGPPLMWSPSPVDVHRYEKKSQGMISLRNSSTSQSSKSKHRLTKHTPTFVDESLFGDKLPEPSFESPWAEKIKNNCTPLYWDSPQDYNRQMTQGSIRDKREPFSLDGRPPSRQGRRPGSNRNRPLTVESITSSKAASVWKP